MARYGQLLTDAQWEKIGPLLATPMPSFNSSPAMRGAPQPGLARLIRRRISATSPGTEGRPAGGRLFHLPYSRNPCRC
jgi:hypothetical protein